MLQTLPLIQALKNLAFPEVCQICHSKQAGQSEGFACKSCRANLRRITPAWCEQCGLPFAGLSDEPLTCSNCHEADWKFNQARSLFSARGVVREVVHRFKYNNHEYFEPMIAEWMQDATPLFPNRPNCIVPVPLHPLKERERGFNQAERLGISVAALFKVPLKTDLLKRLVYTETQTNLSRKERIENMKGAFCAKRNHSIKRILLVDDVMTTGATASACAEALLQTGAQNVDVLTLARGEPV